MEMAVKRWKAGFMDGSTRNRCAAAGRKHTSFVDDDFFRNMFFITATSQQTVAGHDPAFDEAVFLKSLGAVVRTTRIHHTPVPVSPGNCLSEKLKGIRHGAGVATL